MTVWKYPLSRKMIQRSMIASAPPHAPLHAFATDEGPQADASSTHSRR